jgi:hypothetical protein
METKNVIQILDSKENMAAVIMQSPDGSCVMVGDPEMIRKAREILNSLKM